MERSLWDHMFNVFFRDSNLSKKFSFIWRSSMVSFLWRMQPSHSISDFVWFSFRPEHLSKSDNNSNNFDTDWTSERSTVVSSAYCESLTSLCLSIAIPFISSDRLILWASNSIAIMNIVPESGQPWHTPRSRWKCFEAYPLFETQLEISL